jgi:aspartate-semialdehyde dehydrogenase
MPPGPRQLSRVAIAGASSLRGKELKLVLEERNFPAGEIILLDESVMAGTLTEAAGEPTFIRTLQEDSFEGARFVFFAGGSADAERNWEIAQRVGAAVIDLTGVVAASGRATIWIPSLESLLLPTAGSRANGLARTAAYYSPPSPVVIACTLAAALGKLSPQRIMILFFPPVSERGQAGVEELETQTTNLLCFREISKTVFDEQVAFNLLAGYGEGSKPRMQDVRNAVAREVAQYLRGRAPLPAIQLVQAPVFYGYAFAAYAEFASPVPVEKLQAGFAGLGVKFTGAGDPAPTNVSVAGENEIQVARIEPDPNISTGVWLWGVADNLRLAATNAVRIAEELLAESPVQ